MNGGRAVCILAGLVVDVVGICDSVDNCFANYLRTPSIRQQFRGLVVVGVRPGQRVYSRPPNPSPNNLL